jgi:hypothetical protein
MLRRTFHNSTPRHFLARNLKVCGNALSCYNLKNPSISITSSSNLCISRRFCHSNNSKENTKYQYYNNVNAEAGNVSKIIGSFFKWGISAYLVYCTTGLLVFVGFFYFIKWQIYDGFDSLFGVSKRKKALAKEEEALDLERKQIMKRIDNGKYSNNDLKRLDENTNKKKLIIRKKEKLADFQDKLWGLASLLAICVIFGIYIPFIVPAPILMLFMYLFVFD